MTIDIWSFLMHRFNILQTLHVILCLFVSGPVLLSYPEKNPPESWGCSVLLCKQCHSTNLSYHGTVVPGKSYTHFELIYSSAMFFITSFIFAVSHRSTTRRTFSSTLPTVMRVCMGTAKGKSDHTTTLYYYPTSLPTPFIHLNIKLSSLEFPE